MPSIVWTIISFIIIFTVIVVAHEFGHFLLGRLNGIKVNEFAIGMGPVLFRKQFTNTLFTIRLLPIGGACTFEGEDGIYEDEEQERKEPQEGSFQKATVWGRIATVFAGPFFNFILAFLLALVITWLCGADAPVVREVTPGLPAQAAGMQAGDEIVKINNQNIYLWREVSLISMMNNGEMLDIVYERNGERYSAIITPEYSETDGRYYIGFQGSGKLVECDNLNVFKYAFLEVRYWLIATFKSLGFMISGQATADDIAGPVGIATVIDDTIEQTSQYGVLNVVVNMMNIAVLLSVNLGVINLLPLPALDGGRLVFLLIEAIRGKALPAEKEGMVHLIGFVALMILMLFVLYNDIMRIFR